MPRAISTLALLLITCMLAPPLANAQKKGMNISVFAYRDNNRDGSYDLSDRPYAGLPVELSRPNKNVYQTRSNISGFTNFKMSTINPQRPITEPGEYRILAKPREGWRITSNNAQQTLRIKALKGSPGGLVAEKTLVPIGVAPLLNIHGRLSREFKGVTIVALSPKGERKSVLVNDDLSFSLPGSKGLWTLEMTTADGESFKREHYIGNYPLQLSTWSKKHSVGRKAKIIAFDDLTTSDTLYEIPNGYGGLHWTNWIATHQKSYRGHGYINNTTSGEYMAYNSSGHPASIHSETPFDFLGTHVGVAWPRAEKGALKIKAWRNKDLAYEDTLKLTTAGPVYFAAQYEGITRIEFATEYYWQIVVDDMSVQLGEPLEP